LPQIENDRGAKINSLNTNFEKKEFKELWNRINKKAAYSVHFKSKELVNKCIQTLNKELHVTPLQSTIEHGEQTENVTYDQVNAGEGFEVKETSTQDSVRSVHSTVKYDLIGKLVEGVQLTRQTIAEILTGIEKAVFSQFKTNPENFITETIR